jgi:ribosomal protein S18 acetylase RimI-like enzyme
MVGRVWPRHSGGGRPLNSVVRRHRTVIAYSDSLDGLDASSLDGFLAHWDFTPPEGTLLIMLKQSTAVILARDGSSSRICGYVAALSDGIACGYISALEVRPEFRGRGIGTALLGQMTDRLNVFGVYLSCAPSMREFYAARGFSSVAAMCKRRKAQERGNDV